MKKMKFNLGFTLIEMMIAVVIMTVVLAGAVKVEANNIRLASTNKHRLQAINLAQSELNIIKTIRDNKLTSSDPFVDLPRDDPSKIRHTIESSLYNWQVRDGVKTIKVDTDGTVYTVKLYIKSAVDTSTLTSPPLTDKIDARNIEVKVTWDERGHETEIKMNTILHSITP